MLSLSNGSLYLSCQRVEILGTKFAILKDKLMQWVVLTPRLKNSSTMIRNGMKSHAIPWVIILIHGQAASYSPQSSFRISKQLTKRDFQSLVLELLSQQIVLSNRVSRTQTFQKTNSWSRRVFWTKKFKKKWKRQVSLTAWNWLSMRTRCSCMTMRARTL